MQSRLWSVLYRPIDLITYPRHAEGEARGCPLCATDRGQQVQAFREAGAASSLWESTAF